MALLAIGRFYAVESQGVEQAALWERTDRGERGKVKIHRNVVAT